MTYPTLDLSNYGAIRSVAFNLDGSLIVTASDDASARVWEVQTGRLRLTLEGQTKAVNSASFGDGARIITASEDGLTCIWDASSGDKRHALDHGGAAAKELPREVHYGG